MTYNDITKRLKDIDASIALVKEQMSKEKDEEKLKQMGYTVDYLCGYKNYWICNVQLIASGFHSKE